MAGQRKGYGADEGVGIYVILYPIPLELIELIIRGQSGGIVLLSGDILFKKVCRVLTSTGHFLHRLAQGQARWE